MEPNLTQLSNYTDDIFIKKIYTTPQNFSVSTTTESPTKLHNKSPEELFYEIYSKRYNPNVGESTRDNVFDDLLKHQIKMKELEALQKDRTEVDSSAYFEIRKNLTDRFHSEQ